MALRPTHSDHAIVQICPMTTVYTVGMQQEVVEFVWHRVTVAL